MNRVDRGRTFADRSCHTPVRSGAHVTGRKNAGHTCFKQERIAIKVPSAYSLIRMPDVGSSKYKSHFITFYHARNHFRAWRGANEDKHCRCVRHTLGCRLNILQYDLLEMVLAA